MIDTILATIGCVTGIMGFLTGSAALIWAIGSARSTHRIEYQPLPSDPMTLYPESEPSDEDTDALTPEPASDEIPEPKEERLAAQKPKVITSFSEIYGDLND